MTLWWSAVSFPGLSSKRSSVGFRRGEQGIRAGYLKVLDQARQIPSIFYEDVRVDIVTAAVQETSLSPRSGPADIEQNTSSKDGSPVYSLETISGAIFEYRRVERLRRSVKFAKDIEEQIRRVGKLCCDAGPEEQEIGMALVDAYEKAIALSSIRRSKVAD